MKKQVCWQRSHDEFDNADEHEPYDREIDFLLHEKDAKIDELYDTIDEL